MLKYLIYINIEINIQYPNNLPQTFLSLLLDYIL